MAPEYYWGGRWVPLPGDPEDDHDAGWGRRPEPPPPAPPLLRRLGWHDYWGCVIIALCVYSAAAQFRGVLLDDDHSVANLVALLVTRAMHMLLVMIKSSPAPPSSWTALALLPTCPPAPAVTTPPVCYEWEKPAVAMVLPSSSGSADRNCRSDYMAAKKCFDSLVLDASWTCDEQDDDYNAAVKCFDILVHDAARICFVWRYDAIPQTPQYDGPPPT